MITGADLVIIQAGLGGQETLKGEQEGASSGSLYRNESLNLAPVCVIIITDHCEFSLRCHSRGQGVETFPVPVP